MRFTVPNSDETVEPNDVFANRVDVRVGELQAGPASTIAVAMRITGFQPAKAPDQLMVLGVWLQPEQARELARSLDRGALEAVRLAEEARN